MGLHPLEWEELVRQTATASPYNAEVVRAAFRRAQAVVALLTPDDEARLHPSLASADDPEHERQPSGQPRPNVLIEAGMALHGQPHRIVVIEIGRFRPASDLAGMNTVRIDGTSSEPLKAIALRLQTPGCAANDTGTDWLNFARFSRLLALTRRPASPQA